LAITTKPLPIVITTKMFRKIVCTTLSSDFRKATEIITLPIESLKVEKDLVLFKVEFVGINASDINMTKGVYFADTPPPFDVGFEAGNYIKRLCMCTFVSLRINNDYYLYSWCCRRNWPRCQEI